MILIHSKKDDSIISTEVSTQCTGDPRNDQFFRWILLAVSHGKIVDYRLPSTASSSSITQGTLWVRDLRSICEELLNCVFFCEYV